MATTITLPAHYWEDLVLTLEVLRYKYEPDPFSDHVPPAGMLATLQDTDCFIYQRYRLHPRARNWQSCFRGIFFHRANTDAMEDHHTLDRVRRRGHLLVYEGTGLTVFFSVREISASREPDP